jgi:hypothetical protein
VINLETSVAITHNFVNDNNLKKVYTFLKTKEVCQLSFILLLANFLVSRAL